MDGYSRRRDNTWIWAVAGGGLALAAILLALVLGAVALFWAIRRPATAAPSFAGPVSPAKSAPTAAGRERLIGTWDTVIAARGTAVMELRVDGTMIVTVARAAGGQATVNGRWEASGTGDRLRFRRISPGSDVTTDIQFSDVNTFTILGEAGGLTYRRR